MLKGVGDIVHFNQCLRLGIFSAGICQFVRISEAFRLPQSLF
jgi:hypothetical protein